jgi:hypothetical protein
MPSTPSIDAQQGTSQCGNEWSHSAGDITFAGAGNDSTNVACWDVATTQAKAVHTDDGEDGPQGMPMAIPLACDETRRWLNLQLPNNHQNTDLNAKKFAACYKCYIFTRFLKNEWVVAIFGGPHMFPFKQQILLDHVQDLYLQQVIKADIEHGDWALSPHSVTPSGKCPCFPNANYPTDTLGGYALGKQLRTTFDSAVKARRRALLNG